jgi:hypothetical protein
MIRIMAMIRSTDMIRPSDPTFPEEDVVSILRAALPGWKWTRSSPGKGVDFELSGPRGARVVLEVKSARDGRREAVEGALARAILQLQRVRLAVKSTAMVALALPRIGPRTVDRVRGFMAEHAPDAAWAVVGGDGSYAVELAAHGVSEVALRSSLDRGLRPTAIGTSALFTDLNCWLLKVLLLREVSSALWSGPRGPIRTPIELMTTGSVSRITAYRFVKTFTDADYLRATPTGLQVVRRDKLLGAWRGAAETAAIRRVPVRWLLGRPRRVEDVFTTSKMHYAITGFEACRRRGFLHANSKRTEVYVPHIERALTRLDLAPASAVDADFIFSRGPSRRAAAQRSSTGQWS